MKAVIFAYSRQGCQTARRIMEHLDGEIWAYTMERFGEDGFLPIPRPSHGLYGDCFHWADAFVFVSSCGIAVREIAPYVEDKRTDPAVVAIDELGRFAVPLLSGHIGGANGLALQLAEAIGATPVITTATDIHNRFSVDSWAVREGYVISSMKWAKDVSAAILERDIPLHSDFPIIGALPNGIVSRKGGSLGICISYRTEEPYEKTLRLIPKILHLGIGCRKGTAKEAISEAVNKVLLENNIDFRAVKCAASIDIKAHEEGLLAYCRGKNLPVTFYTAEELQEVKGNFTPSEFVKSVTDVDNVCERSALIGADQLIVRKQAWNGVTVAIAEETQEVHFG